MDKKRKPREKVEPPMCGVPISADYWAGKPITIVKPYRLWLQKKPPKKSSS